MSAPEAHLYRCHPTTAYQKSRSKMTTRSDRPPMFRADSGEVGAKVRYSKTASAMNTTPASSENTPKPCQPGVRHNSAPTSNNVIRHTSTTTADARL